MREKIGSLMKEKEDDEDERIKKAQREMEEKQEREMAAKVAKQQKAIKAMGQHRWDEVGRLVACRSTSSSSKSPAVNYLQPPRQLF